MDNFDTTANYETKTTSSHVEELLKPNASRFVLFPLKYPALWKMYETQKAAYWDVGELNFSSDVVDWKSLNNNEQFFLENVLAFFAASDGIVAENLAQVFYNEVQIPEARMFYGFQLMMEGTHSHTYSLLIDTYIKDNAKKDKLLNAIQEIQTVKDKAEWALKWIDPKYATFAERLVAFAVVEGIFFSGSFCAIFWVKKFKSKLPCLSQSNQLISRDEGLHCDFACLLYSMLSNKLSKDRIHTIVKEAVNIEKDFVSKSLPVELIGMNSGEMCKYIEFIADRLLKQLGYEPIYKSENPFDWMENISLNGKTNFFEQTPTEYKKAKEVRIDNTNHDFSNPDF